MSPKADSDNLSDPTREISLGGMQQRLSKVVLRDHVSLTKGPIVFSSMSAAAGLYYGYISPASSVLHVVANTLTCTLKKLEKPIETIEARRDLPPICLPFKVVVDPMSCGVDDDDDDAGAMSFSCIWLHISALLPPNPTRRLRVF
ncbi:hypothetical protein PGTUg99_017660 [Puccinia graminis f. sp. tritici]|uniref:Uncharacterized protein n=1 Tax=Puccinia graminis f. sp. tritici TaxID=56615 RepID=A0A5B0REA9_PUCGR|nr:hypothetical protein PGTUg99_017660 [Puccinia graminis f. sp. tritici]